MSVHNQAEDAGSPEREELLLLRAEVARLQRERDDAWKASQKPPGMRAGMIRRIVSVLLVVLTAILAFVTVPALYLRSEVLDSERYLEMVAPLASDPAIQSEIADKVTVQIIGAVDIEGITRDALTELSNSAPRAAAVITGLAPVIAGQTRSLIQSTVSNFVATQQFQDLWRQLNRVAHQGLVNLATGAPDAAASIDESGAVTISTREIIARVKGILIQNGVAIAARIPEVDAQITVLQSPELARASEAIRTLDRAAPALAWLTALSSVGAVAVAPRGSRRRATGNLAMGVALAMALLAFGLFIGRGVLLDSIPADTVSPAAAGSLTDALLAPLRNNLRFVLVVALLVGAAAFLSGHSRPAEVVRHGLARTGDYLTGKLGTGPAKPWQRWLARYRRILEAAVAGVAVLVLIFWQYPTPAVAIWIAILAGLAILLIELLSRPAAPAVPATEPAANSVGMSGGGP